MSCRLCGKADSGTTDLCARCEARAEHEQNQEDQHETGRPWADGYCWLSRFASTPCEGRIDPAHLIAKQLLKREHVPALWDRSIIVPACRKHHAALDTARTLRVPREALPPGVEEFARRYGLEWYLAREFGERAA